MKTSLSSQKNGSALIISLVIMTLMTMMTTVFFEKVYRFSQRSEGIENSNVAYYKALGIIEDSLYTGTVDKYTPWNIQDNTVGDITYATSGATMVVATGGNTIPVVGKGNSPYDISKEYNIISLGEPVQIVIPNGINWNSIFFEFRVPIMPNNSSTGVDTSMNNSGVILWTFASSGVSLFASGEVNTFRGFQINSDTPGDQIISTFSGTTNSGSLVTFDTFYNDINYLGGGGAGIICTDYKCTLKLSMIRTVSTTDQRNLSFLEYKIRGFGTKIPSQYMDIEAKGYAYGFLRSRNIQFPQITTNTALDFAVLQ